MNRKLIAEIIERSKHPYYQNIPYYNRRDGKPSWQWRFMAAAKDYQGRVAIGGNRIGKSRQAAYEAVLAITGKHPYREFPKEGIGWVVGLDNKMIDRIDRPMFEMFLPDRYKTHFDKQRNIWTCRNDEEGIYWEVEFKSTEMGRDKFQGAKVDFIWFDEEPGKTDIFNECMMRLIDRDGIWWMAATPINGTIWLKELSERENVFSVTGAMWDNPFLPLARIEEEVKNLTEEERWVRVEGRYIVFGGKPVFNIKVLNKMLDEATIPAEKGLLVA